MAPKHTHPEEGQGQLTKRCKRSRSPYAPATIQFELPQITPRVSLKNRSDRWIFTRRSNSSKSIRWHGSLLLLCVWRGRGISLCNGVVLHPLPLYEGEEKVTFFFFSSRIHFSNSNLIWMYKRAPGGRLNLTRIEYNDRVVTKQGLVTSIWQLCAKKKGIKVNSDMTTSGWSGCCWNISIVKDISIKLRPSDWIITIWWVGATIVDNRSD